MNIIVIGPPGVGKGTYAEILSRKYNIPKISSGDLFHKAIREETHLGKEIGDYVSKGELVPDAIVIKLIKERLEENDCREGFLLDGFPRTITQAEAMETSKVIHRVLNFVAPDEEVLSRLSGRRTCRKCGEIYHLKNRPPRVSGICDNCGGKLYQRSDETPDVFRNRLNVYRKKTKPVIDYFRKKSLLVDIDASYPYEEIGKVIAQCDEALSEIR